MDNPGKLLTKTFAMDLRSLAVFRMALGLLILWDLLWQRWPCLHAHYSGGVMDPALLADESRMLGWFLSLHQLFPDPTALHTLFAVQALLAVALIAGWRTWVIAPLNWLLLCSLQAANFFVLDGGDALLRLMLLFGCFLPLGARWSLDARRRQSPALTTLPPVFLPAAACLMLQVAAVYWFSVFFKTDPMWTQSYDLLYYAFHTPLYAKAPALFLAGYPALLKVVTFLVYWWEVLGPLWVLVMASKPRLRLAGIGVFWLFHFMIFLSFGLEVFSFACMTGWVVFVPGKLWDRFNHETRTAPSSAAVQKPSRALLATQGVAVGLFLLALLGNAVSVQGKRFHEMPQPFRSVATAFMLNQTWRAFSTEATLSQQYWVGIDGQTDDGQWLNLITGQPADGELPPSIRHYFPNERWRHSILFLLQKRNRAHLPVLMRHYADAWNAHATADEQVHRVRFVLYADQTEPPGVEPVQDIRQYTLYETELP